MQAKENTTIPPKIIEDLTKEFKKYNNILPLIINSIEKRKKDIIKYNQKNKEDTDNIFSSHF